MANVKKLRFSICSNEDLTIFDVIPKGHELRNEFLKGKNQPKNITSNDLLNIARFLYPRLKLKNVFGKLNKHNLTTLALKVKKIDTESIIMEDVSLGSGLNVTLTEADAVKHLSSKEFVFSTHSEEPPC